MSRFQRRCFRTARLRASWAYSLAWRIMLRRWSPFCASTTDAFASRSSTGVNHGGGAAVWRRGGRAVAVDAAKGFREDRVPIPIGGRVPQPLRGRLLDRRGIGSCRLDVRGHLHGSLARLPGLVGQRLIVVAAGAVVLHRPLLHERAASERRRDPEDKRDPEERGEEQDVFVGHEGLSRLSIRTPAFRL